MKNEDIKAPEGYELVPKEEWDVSPKDLEFKFLHESGWGNLHNDGRSLNNWHSHDPEFYKAFARPIKATVVIKPSDDVPEGYEEIPSGEFEKTAGLIIGFNPWTSKWEGPFNATENKKWERDTFIGFARPLKKDSKDPVPPEGYEMVPESDWNTVPTMEHWLFHLRSPSSWCPLITYGLTVNEFKAKFAEKVGPIVRRIKKEVPTQVYETVPENPSCSNQSLLDSVLKGEVERPSTGMKDLADKLDTAQLKDHKFDTLKGHSPVGSKEFAKGYREYCESLSKEIFGDLRKEDPYQKTYAGLKIDPYRVGQIFGITHPAQFQALKKILRAGRSHKPLVQDIEEAIESLERWLEMIKEDGK